MHDFLRSDALKQREKHETEVVYVTPFNEDPVRKLALNDIR